MRLSFKKEGHRLGLEQDFLLRRPVAGRRGRWCGLRWGDDEQGWRPSRPSSSCLPCSSLTPAIASLTRASLQPPLPSWLPPTQTSYSQSGRSRENKWDSLSALNGPLFLPQGAQAPDEPMGSTLCLLLGPLGHPQDSLELSLLTSRPGPSYWSGLPKVSVLELKGSNSTQTGEFRPHIPNSDCSPDQGWLCQSRVREWSAGCWSVQQADSSRQ